MKINSILNFSKVDKDIDTKILPGFKLYDNLLCTKNQSYTLVYLIQEGGGITVLGGKFLKN